MALSRSVKDSTMTQLRLLAALALLSLAGCGKSSDEGAAAGRAQRAALVRTGPVTRETVQPTTSAVGSVVARRTSVVASGADGKVNQFLVSEGDIVEEDQELSILNMVTTNLEIDEAEAMLQEREQEYQAAQTSRPEEIEEAQARMEAAAVTRDIAAERLARWVKLSQGGAAAQDSLDDARERSQAAGKLYLAAKAAYDLVLAGPREEAKQQAKARRDAQQHHVDFLKAERDKRTTHAPFRGIVVREHTESGQWLAKADPVVTIADLLEAVEIEANVDQSELGNVQVGATVQVAIDGVEPREWQGCVLSVVPRSDWESGSRMFPVRVSVPNKVIEIDGREQPVLREGMLARVTFSGPPHEATLVPKNALVRSETASRLYTVLPGEKPETGKAQPVIVQEGGFYGDRVEILGDALQPGMQVVTEGAERLTPFADVMIQPDAPAEGQSGTSSGPTGEEREDDSPSSPAQEDSTPDGKEKPRPADEGPPGQE
ncbi:MAG: efflux RND transporter periplasmic adaptor subunit [Planctomycetaceae bacterium]|nr:efflux RND transporter periplasmic adaptor subunit [Planctomycetaceae bacterium]